MKQARERDPYCCDTSSQRDARKTPITTEEDQRRYVEARRKIEADMRAIYGEEQRRMV